MDHTVLELPLRVVAALDAFTPSGATPVTGTITRNRFLVALLFLVSGWVVAAVLGYAMIRLRVAAAAKPLYVLVAVTTTFFASIPFVPSAGTASFIELLFQWSALGARCFGF